MAETFLPALPKIAIGGMPSLEEIRRAVAAGEPVTTGSQTITAEQYRANPGLIASFAVNALTPEMKAEMDRRWAKMEANRVYAGPGTGPLGAWGNGSASLTRGSAATMFPTTPASPTALPAQQPMGMPNMFNQQRQAELPYWMKGLK